MPSLWSRIKNTFKEQSTAESYNTPHSNFANWYGTNFYGINSGTLETNETIFSIVTRLSNTVASLPLHLIDDKGNSLASDSLYRLATVRPNPNMTAFEMWNKVETDRNSRGNGYVFIEPDMLFQPAHLWPINPDYVVPMINEEDQSLWYRIQGGQVTNTGQGTGQWLMVPSSQMIHVKHITGTSRILGISPIDVLQGVLEFDQEVTTFQLSEMKKRDSFKIVYGSNVSDEKKKAVIEDIRRFLNERGGVLFSEPGVEVDFMERKISTQDIADSDTISRRRIANAFNIPVSFLNETGDSGYNTNEQLMLQFVQMTLTPIVRQYEAELCAKLLSPSQQNRGFYWKFNMNGLLRGDTASRTAFYQMAIRNGIYTENEIRKKEDLPPAADPNADKLLISGDLYPIDLDPEKRKGTTSSSGTDPGGNSDDNEQSDPSNTSTTKGGDNNDEK